MGTGMLLTTLLVLSLSISANGAPAIPFYCRLDEARCPSGKAECIRATDICNGVKDCSDGSDELPAVCKSYNCSNRNIERPSPYWGDVLYTAGALCPSKKMCTQNPVGDYIAESRPEFVTWPCNGVKDCIDGSDEDPTYCKNVDCTKFVYGMHNGLKCPSGRYCMYARCAFCTRAASEYLCDGIPDCPDGSDEWPSFCKNNRGAFSEFQCNDGKCLTEGKTCNGVKDCRGGEDEAPAFCRGFRCESKFGGLKCPDNRTCISQAKICDGKRDCSDGSDEDPVRCRSFKCPEGAWKCKDGVQCTSARLDPPIIDGRPGIGVPSDTRCEGVYDCKDKSDESPALCKTFKCASDQLKCPGGNGGCIRNWRMCDGKVDCLDGSDEGKQFCKTFKCPTTQSSSISVDQIKCTKDNKCIFGGLCDGSVACDDGTDEDPSFCRAYKCPAGQTKCPSFPYQCIRTEQVCDGYVDCITGADERKSFCKNYECPTVFRGGQLVKCPGGLICRPPDLCT